MLSLAVAVLAAAVWCWPSGAGRGRLGSLASRSPAPDPGPAARRQDTGRWIVPHLILAAGCGQLLAGPGGALAAVMAVGTAVLRLRAGRHRRVRAVAATGLADGLAVLVSELRAGAHVGDAAAAAATSGHADAGRVLAAAAAAARLGGDIPAVLRSTSPAHLRPYLGRLAHAWALADRHGIPLADLLDAVRADVEQRVRFVAEIQARLAGPRTTAAVLAGLPLLGLGIGQAMGAEPLSVLAQTGAGQVLLVLGTTLACAGVLWSARLVAGAVPE